MRVLALDHGSARCGVAVSDPTGTLATPLDSVDRPDTKRGLAAVVRLVEDQGAERKVSVPVELHDERLTTRLAERTGGQGDADSRAAAHLLESYLARTRAGIPE